VSTEDVSSSGGGDNTYPVRRIILATKDGVSLAGAGFASMTQPPQANVLIVHGMAEHIGRYRSFAEFLVSKGIGVYGFDLRGHGQTAKTGKNPDGNAGFFVFTDGWDALVRDIDLWVNFIQKETPGVPLFLLGHSLGSFLARTYAALYGNKLSGLILSGTGSIPKFRRAALCLAAKIEDEINGRKEPGTLLSRFIFRMFARSVKDRRTRFDWLSRDEKIVDAFIADPLCGRPLPAGFLYDFLKGAAPLRKPSFLRKTPKNLPLHIISGSRDPVGNFSKSVTDVYKEYQKAGLSNIIMKIYSGGRHEMLNETNRDEVYRDVLAWLQSKLAHPDAVQDHALK
jgi:alpha-beta hydrolase superfamily lysophospholipase